MLDKTSLQKFFSPGIGVTSFKNIVYSE